jgi:hypothetical protein
MGELRDWMILRQSMEPNKSIPDFVQQQAECHGPKKKE